MDLAIAEPAGGPVPEQWTGGGLFLFGQLTVRWRPVRAKLAFAEC
jgi:hypothetical protein